MMRAGRFENPGTFERPGPLGRVVRIAAGCAFFYFFVITVTQYGSYVSLALPRHPMRWFGVALSFYVLADVVNVGFTRSWGWWPQLVFGGAALFAMVFDLLQYGSLWGPPLGFLIFLLLAYVTGHLGLSFILAGVVGVPG